MKSSFRGQKLYNDIANVNLPEKVVAIPRQGRSAELLKERNLQMFYRYYYYSIILKWRYDQILEQLKIEFSLSTNRIVDVLIDNSEIIKDIATKKPSLPILSKMYPHFKWSFKNK